jgi:hypothetical protein
LTCCCTAQYAQFTRSLHIFAEQAGVRDGLRRELAELCAANQASSFAVVKVDRITQPGRHHVRRHTGADVKTDRDDAWRVAAREVDHLVPVERAQIGRLAVCIDIRCRKGWVLARQARRFQVALPSRSTLGSSQYSFPSVSRSRSEPGSSGNAAPPCA